MPKSTISTRRHSVPNAFQPSSSQAMSNFWPPQQGMMMMCPPWAMPAQPHQPPSSQTSKRPWSSDSDEDEDFKPTQKNKKPAQRPSTGKRGPGRPSNASKKADQKAEEESRKEAADLEEIVKSYPARYVGALEFETNQALECPNCSLYTGTVALLPCGHGKFCIKCVNILRDKAVRLGKPQHCLAPSCLEMVKNWVKLFHHTF